ncbi:hypothetical protein ACFX12_019431 [Malus domestica]
MVHWRGETDRKEKNKQKPSGGSLAALAALKNEKQKIKGKSVRDSKGRWEKKGCPWQRDKGRRAGCRGGSRKDGRKIKKQLSCLAVWRLGGEKRKAARLPEGKEKMRGESSM